MIRGLARIEEEVRVMREKWLYGIVWRLRATTGEFRR
jgi:hypothetical protein